MFFKTGIYCHYWKQVLQNELLKSDTSFSRDYLQIPDVIVAKLTPKLCSYLLFKTTEKELTFVNFSCQGETNEPAGYKKQEKICQIFWIVFDGKEKLEIKLLPKTIYSHSILMCVFIHYPVFIWAISKIVNYFVQRLHHRCFACEISEPYFQSWQLFLFFLPLVLHRSSHLYLLLHHWVSNLFILSKYLTYWDTETEFFMPVIDFILLQVI